MTAIDEIVAGFDKGLVIPYLGPDVAALAGADCTVPVSPAELAAKLTAAASVPHKIRNNLTAISQIQPIAPYTGNSSSSN